MIQSGRNQPNLPKTNQADSGDVDGCIVKSQLRRVFVVGLVGPSRFACFEALREFCDVIVISPVLTLAAWIPLPLPWRRGRCELPRGAFSHRRWLVRLLAPFVGRRLEKSYGRGDVVIIADPSFWPFAIHYRRLAPVVAYHVFDDYAAYPYVRLDQEVLVARHVDLLFSVSRSIADILQRRCGFQLPPVHVIPNGFPGSWLPASLPSQRQRMPDPLSEDFRPLIGIIGVISSRVDLLPILAAHDALPALHWLFIGPVYRDVPGLADLQRSPRCRFLGAMPYETLQPYFATLDAAVLPLTDGDINPCSSPVRFFSQLPTGQPILYTGTCAQIAETPHLAYHCADGQALTATLEHLAASGFQDGRAADRHRFASGCTWQKRAEAMADALAATLEARRRTPSAR